MSSNPKKPDVQHLDDWGLSFDKNNYLPESESIVSDLCNRGLTRSQAVIYLALLRSGSSDVRSICAATRIHRSDVYRNLKALGQIGVIETEVGPPARYDACEPEFAVSTLTRMARQRQDRLASKSESLSRRLVALKSVSSNHVSSERDVRSTFSLIVGRTRYWRETKSLVEQSKHEIIRIVDSQGLKTMVTTDLFQDFVSAADRDVKIRVIAEVTSDNLSEALLCRKHFEIKHLGSIVLRFIGVDSTEVILCGSLDRANVDNELTHNRFLKFSDASFAKSMRFFFSGMWEIAQPIESLMKPLSH
jgi:sugar-specific transcriptional regulator TrmB